MLTLPAKTRRKKQPYLSIRSHLTRRNLRRQATVFFSELRDFITRRGIDDSGSAFMRYLTIDRQGEMDIEFGYFTGRVHPGGGPVRSGILPAGTFMSVEWIGPHEKIAEITAMLPGWAMHNGLELDISRSEQGLSYGCRLEIFHVTPRHTDDPRDYRSEIAVLARPAGEAAAVVRPTQAAAAGVLLFEHIPAATGDTQMI